TQFDPAVIDTPALREGLLNQLINQRLLANVAADNRFSVSDETLRNTIAAIPEVQDNGRFSPERYRQVLAAQGMSPTSFEAGLRRDLAIARVL
ncbi:SurA N-terminal domain-containing protein, partial [Paenibacillus polymyxa]|nr:SurA N-terminal domain-containing protein [Paenibacillus polymyxa]